MFRSISIALGLLLILVVNSSASPVLLASYMYHVDSALSPANDARIEFVLQLPPDELEFPPLTCALGGGVFWENGQTGDVTFTASNSLAFLDFANHITDGIDGPVELFDLTDSGGGAVYELESILVNRPLDLIGNRLDEVHLTVHSLTFTDWNPNPSEPAGMCWVADVSWSFFGTPIPEPTMICCFTAIFFLVQNSHRGIKEWR